MFSLQCVRVNAVAPPTTVTFYVVADSYVSCENGDTNYGSLTYMLSVYNANRIDCPVIRFNLSSIPDNVNILSASLKVYVTEGYYQYSYIPFQWYNMTNTNWDETVITWNNMGTYGPIGSQTVNVNATGWWTWTVTSFVQYAYSRTSKLISFIGFKAYGSSDTSYVKFATKEYSATYKARLDVTYQPVASWKNIENWSVIFKTAGWKNVESWIVNPVIWQITKIWHLIENWLFELASGFETLNIRSVQIPLFFMGLAFIGLSIFGGIKIHHSSTIAMFWVFLFFFGLAFLIAAGSIGGG